MLKFIALSGTTNVTENFYVYEYNDEIIIVDCGVGFPEPEMLGVDLVLPDFTYVLENKQKVKGILISHGHEDHLGALPFLMESLNVPIYATKLVAGFIENKFTDTKSKVPTLKIFDPERDVLSLGSFKITPFRVSHSVPDGVGYCIDTPIGKVFHVADYKFDWTPVDGRPFDLGKCAMLASSGALALVSDSLGSTTTGYTQSEREIESILENIVREKKGRIFFSTISSNISRMQQMINVAQKYNRKICYVGRSIESKATIAENLGYMKIPSNIIVAPQEAEKLADSEVVYIISGSYGQPGSALYRFSMNEHKFLKVKQSDIVIFSSDPAPPGSKLNVDYVVDKLIEQDIEVHYYDMQEDLHVSGHGSMEDIRTLMSVVKPKYFIPVGGTTRHMKGYRDLAISTGAKAEDVFMLKGGDSVYFENDKASKGKRIPVRQVLVDGLGIGDVGTMVLRDRQHLSKEGIAICVITLDRTNNTLAEKPEIISRGFVFAEKNYDVLRDAGNRLKQELERSENIDSHSIKEKSVNFLERHFFETLGRRPMVLPVIVEV